MKVVFINADGDSDNYTSDIEHLLKKIPEGGERLGLGLTLGPMDVFLINTDDGGAHQTSGIEHGGPFLKHIPEGEPVGGCRLSLMHCARSGKPGDAM